MSPRDWRDLGTVYRAGAVEFRSLTFKVDRREQAKVLDIMADRCEEIADERNRLERVTATNEATALDEEYPQ